VSGVNAVEVLEEGEATLPFTSSETRPQYRSEPCGSRKGVYCELKRTQMREMRLSNNVKPGMNIGTAANSANGCCGYEWIQTHLARLRRLTYPAQGDYVPVWNLTPEASWNMNILRSRDNAG
jgi:hypothetical protein